MPPRKSTASTASAPDANGDVSMVSNATATSPTQQATPKQSRQSGGGSSKQDDGVGVDDLLLPRSMINRLSRGVLPPNTSIQKDALLALTRSATVFISYLSSHANEQSQLRHRKTLGVQDVYAALREIEFANLMHLGAIGTDGRTGGRLEREVDMFEEISAKKRKGYRDKVKARESGGDAVGEDDGGEPSTKKARRMDDPDADEEESMLAQQLNGESDQHNEGLQSTNQAGDVSVVVPNGDDTGKEKTVSILEQDEDETIDEPDDVEDDPAAADEEEGDLDDEDDEAEDDEEEGEDENGGAEHTDIDDSRRVNGRSHGLLPNGEVELGSDEDSD